MRMKTEVFVSINGTRQRIKCELHRNSLKEINEASAKCHEFCYGFDTALDVINNEKVYFLEIKTSDDND